MDDNQNHRVLIIDDNQAIHDDFRKILCGRNPAADNLTKTEASLFGDAAGGPAVASFEVDSAFQGQAGLACVQHAMDSGRPYAMAFVDVRMPPGWDGIETIERLWKVDPDLQIVICTAYSDYSWSEVVTRVGQSDRLVVLKKPFDNIEVSQLALALTKKWRLTRQARRKLDELEELVRTRTVELTATNESLRTEITERKQMEASLRESEARYRSLFENMLEGYACCRMIFDQDRPQDFVYLDVNTAFEKLTGLKDVVGKKATEVIPEIRETNPELLEIYGRVTRTGKPEKFETYVEALGIWFSVAVCSHQKEHFVAIFDNITERKRIDEDLRQKTALFEGLVNYSPDGILVVDGRGRKVVQNPQFNELLKIPRHLWEQSDDTEQLQYVVNSTKHPEQFQEKVLHLYAHPEEASRDEIELKDGRYLERTSARVLDRDGKYCTRIWMFRDITERKKIEEVLRQSEGKFRALFENARDAMFILDTQGNIVEANQEVCEQLQYNREELLRLRVQDIDTPENAALVSERIRQLFQKGHLIFETANVRRDGTIVPVEINSQKLELEGQILILAVCRDLTERKQMEQALRESEKRYRELLDSQDDGVVIADEEQHFVFVNPALGKMLCLPPEQLLGRRMQDFLDEEQRAVLSRHVELRKQGMKSIYEVKVMAATGELREVLINASPQMDRHGRFCGTFAVLRDITERKHTEEKLHLQTSALSAAANGIAITNPAGLIVWVNPAFTRLTGYDSSEAIGQTHALLKSGVQDQPFYRNLWATILSGKVWHGDLINKRKDGSLYDEEMTITPVLDEKGEVLNFVAVKQDISQRKRAEEVMKEELALRERLAKLAAKVPGIVYTFRLRPDGSTCIPYASPTIEEFCGVRAEDIVDDASLLFELIHADDQARLRESIMESARTLLPWRAEFRVRHPKKGLFWAEGQSTPERQADGSVLWHGFMSDITDRREADRKIQLNDKRFRTLVEATAAIVWDGPPLGEFAVEQPGWSAFTGQSFEELRGLGWLNAIHPDDHAETTRVWSAAIANRSMCEVEYRLRARDQSYHHMSVRVVPILADDGTIQQWVGVASDITERKQAEVALRDNEAFLNTVVENLPHMIFVKDAKELRFVKFNKAGQELLGYSLADLAGKNDYDFFPKELADHFTENDRKVLRGTEVVDIPEEPVQTRDQGERILHTKKIPIFDNTGQVAYLLGISEDITERKRTQELLLESKRFLQSTLNALSSHIAILDEHGTIIEVNAAWHRFARENGFTGNHGVGDNYLHVCKSADGSCSEEASPVAIGIHNVMTGKSKEFYLEYPCHSPQEERWFIVRATRFGGTGPVRVVVAHENITERMASEAQIERLRAEHAVVLNSLGEGVHWVGVDGRIKFENPAAAKMLGYEIDELVGQPAHDIMHHKRADGSAYPISECGIYATLRDGVVRRVTDEVFWRKDGTCFAVEYVCTPVYEKSGRSGGSVVIFADISQRIQAEQELRAREEAFRALADNVPDAVARIDQNLHFVYGNRALLRETGKEPGAFLGKTADELKLPGSEQWRKELVRVFKTGKARSYEFQWSAPKGVCCLESRLVPEYSSTGEVEFVLTVTRDVTEQKNAEKERQMMELQLRQAQKLEAVGQLAAGIAHEINTPTQYVGDNTRFLKDAFNNIISLLRSHGELLTAAQQNSITPELLERAEETLMASDVEYLFQQIPLAIQETLEGVERVTKIVRAMKEFSHPGGKEKTAADLNKAIESTTTVARNEWKYVADLKLDLDPNLPLVPCFIGEFNQVILNLVVNAAHAISDVVKQHPDTKGTITIQTQPDGDSVVVRVSDTGTGIAEAHRRRIFEPFFTTKDVGKGSGQGLTIVYGTIVKKHGGAVTFETEVGKGTTFIIRLPIHPQIPVPEEPAAAPAEMISNA